METVVAEFATPFHHLPYGARKTKQILRQDNRLFMSTGTFLITAVF